MHSLSFNAKLANELKSFLDVIVVPWRNWRLGGSITGDSSHRMRTDDAFHRDVIFVRWEGELIGGVP